MRTRYRSMFLPLLLFLPTICFADIDKDVQKCRKTQDGTLRASCFQKLIPRLDELSRQGVGNTNWAESLKEAYGATAQFDKFLAANRTIQIDVGADKLLSTVLAQTNNKTQAYIAVAQYFQALGPEWQEAAKRAQTMGKFKENEIAELTLSIKSQVADAIHAVQPNGNAPSDSATSASTANPATGDFSHCLKSVSLSDEGNSAGRHQATVTVENTCSQSLNFNVCIKSERAACWTCKIIPLNPGQSSDGPSSTGYGDCTSATCNGISVVFNATPQAAPPKPNVDDSCHAKAH